jgi:tRNA(Arg) A34 adenosine deaminase TadA
LIISVISATIDGIQFLRKVTLMEWDDLRFLRRAIAIAQQARDHGNHPFGALLVDAQQQVIFEAENTVVTEQDCTGHAETNLMRLASRQAPPEVLAGCTLYSSAEPCAMCAGAIHWGNVGRLVYGVGASRFYELVGPTQLDLSCREVFARSRQPIEVLGPVLEDEALAVHMDFW